MLINFILFLYTLDRGLIACCQQNRGTNIQLIQIALTIHEILQLFRNLHLMVNFWQLVMDEGQDYPDEESGKLRPAPLDEWKAGLGGNIFGNIREGSPIKGAQKA